jgi:hypothetical protein
MERNAETLKGIWILCNSLERKYYMDPLPKVPAVERAFDDRVIILGNGESRKELDLAALKKWCPLFGCNALFTEFPPDILFVVDRPISEEVNRSQYARTHKVVARCPECCTGAEKWIGPGWSAGNVAILYACRQGYKKIYLVGFDLWQNEGGKINNIYKGREHYYGPEHIGSCASTMTWRSSRWGT